MQIPEKKYKWLILPIETKVRELDGKLFLAAIAVERGWAVMIGHKDTIFEDTAGIDGVVIEKDAHSRNKRINRFTESGKMVSAWCEEGLVYLNSQDYYRRRLHEDHLRKMDYFFLWGGIQQRDILEHVRGLDDRLVITGNPRFDLLRPDMREYYQPEARKLRDRYGRFILVNTNFADSNHFLGTDWVIESHRKAGFLTNKQEEANELAFIGYQAQIADHFADMLQEICPAYPDHQIILRPHPSENHKKWVSLAKGLRNMSVIHEGDVNPWLLAADMTIHNSCMTGIQGFLLDRPVISYMPIQSERFDYYIPNALSIQTVNLDGLKCAMDNILSPLDESSLADRSSRMAIANQYIASISGRFASERIMDALDRLHVEPNSYKEWIPVSAPEDPTPIQGNRPGLPARLIHKIFNQGETRKLAEYEKNKLAYSRQKFPGLTQDEVQDKLTDLMGISNRKTRFQIFPHGSQSFCILPE